MQITVATDLLRDVCALQHLSVRTEQSYSYWLRRYIGFLSQPAFKSLPSSEKKVEAFLTSLAHAGVSASTQNQAFNAILFFYRYALEKGFEKVNRKLNYDSGTASRVLKRVWSVPSHSL